MLILPIAIPWVAGVALALLDGRKRSTGVLAAVCLAATFIASMVLAIEVWRNGSIVQVAGDWPVGVGITLRADALGVAFAPVTSAVVLVAFLFELFGGIRTSTFPALTVLLVAGLNGVFLTGDAFNFYVFFEIAMISAYVLTSYGEGRRQLRATAIFAMVNLLGSVFFLISIAALYHVTGRLDMGGISARMALVQTQPAILTGALIFVAFGIKLGLFPFHFWLAAVYTGTRPAVAAILSGALANIGSYGLLRFGGEMLPRELVQGNEALFVLGTLSVLYGAIQAISRRSVAEVLAYSSIGQIGYVMVALALGGELGLMAATLFAVVNALNKTLLFLSENLRGWLAGGAFVIGAFSVAGLPPASGFLGKAAIVRAAVDAGSIATIVLVVAGGALSIIYMIQIYQRRFWGEDTSTNSSQAEGISPLSQRLLTVTVAASIVLLGLWPEPLLRMSNLAAAAIAGGSP